MTFETSITKSAASEIPMPTTLAMKVKSEESLDWSDLRKRSLEAGGFGSSRLSIWPQLLNVSSSNHASYKLEKDDAKVKDEEHMPHRDERQIKLDTDRSFVLYPVGVNRDNDREKLQSELHELLITLFRKRPKLSYFQGYHDIITVLFLTLPPEIQLLCAEKLSLHRVRDSMGSSLEPVLGLLRITKNLLRLTDPEYTAVLEQSSPLPFYALSNLLTLFSHDMPTLPLIQHVFDYLLCRPPISAVYLATALILMRKEEVYRLQSEGEDGMIHSLLSGLPDIVDGVVDNGRQYYESLEDEKAEKKAESVPQEIVPDLVDNEIELAVPITPTSPTPFDPSSNSIDDQAQAVPILPVETNIEQVDDSQSGVVEEDSRGERENLVAGEVSNESEVAANPTAMASSASIVAGLSDETSNSPGKKPGVSITTSAAGEDGIEAALPPDLGSAGGQDEEANPTPPTEVSHRSKASTPDPLAAPRPKVALTSLLMLADALYEKHPPSDPGLSVSSIMGPQSVVFTWSEDFSLLPGDDMAEAMVTRPELVVYPYIEDDADIESSKEEESTSAGNKQKRKRRKLRKSRFAKMEKRTMITGAVIVLGVAMAVYGIKSRSGTAMYDTHHAHAHREQLKRLGGWASGVLVGLSTKLLGGLKG